jgi:hypothetical protein
MHASEDAARLHGASDRLRRALERVTAAESQLAHARRELLVAQRAEYGWTDGLAGRRLVADALVALAPDGWTFLDAVHWPGRPGVVIDHVGVGPGGVVVMFSRQWTGAVEVRGGVLRQNGIPRLRETAAVSAAAGAISALLDPRYRTTVSAFVCAVQHDVVPATVSPGVNVVGVREVDDAVGALTPRLSPLQVAEVLEQLRGALVGPQATDQLTTRALTVYGDGPALPWPGRADDGLFGPPGAFGNVPPTAVYGVPAVGPYGEPPVAAVPGPPTPGVGIGADARYGQPERSSDPAADLPSVQGGHGVVGAGALRDPRVDALQDVDFERHDWGGASRGRHRAPSVLWSRTAHAAEHSREMLAVPLAVAATLGCAAVALLAWLGVTIG